MTFAPAKDSFSIIAHWGRRPETADALAARYIALITRLQVIDPSFAIWSHWDDAADRPAFFDPTPEVQTARILARTPRRPDGTLVPDAGVSLWDITEPYRPARSIQLRMDAGADHQWTVNNSLHLDTNRNGIPDPDIVSYRVFRTAMLAMVETFEATEAFAFPNDLMDLWPKPWPDDRPLLAWLSYVAPRFAHLVSPPLTALVEHRPDGGLLLAATDETFRTTNPAHLAAARDIESALTTFSALPWTAETGK